MFCTLVPFTLKLYVLTDPPARLDAVAVKVTDVPAQIAPDGDAAMLTVGVTFAFTVVVLDAALNELHPAALL